jgi:signal peptidase II
MVRHVAAFLAIAFSGAFLDLATKDLAFEHNHWNGDIPVIEGFLSFGKVLNEGVVFGMGRGAKTFWRVVAILAVPLIAGLFFASLRKPRWLGTITLGMILAGTIGNMVDRVRVGAVRDFLKFFVVVDGRAKVWPLFNLADSYICVGVFLLTLEMLVLEEKRKAASAPAVAPAAETAPPAPAAGPAAPPPGP